MSVDINVNTTETNVNINASTIVETVDITATVQQDTVEIDVYPNVTVVNVTKKDGQDGQDGQDLTLSDFNVAPEAGALNDADRFLIEQGGVWKGIEYVNLKQKRRKYIQFGGLVEMNNTSNFITFSDNYGKNTLSSINTNIGNNPLSLAGTVPPVEFADKNYKIISVVGYYKSYLAVNWNLTLVKGQLTTNKEGYQNTSYVLNPKNYTTAHVRHERFEITSFEEDTLNVNEVLFVFFNTPTPNGSNQRLYQSDFIIELEEI